MILCLTHQIQTIALGLDTPEGYRYQNYLADFQTMENLCVVVDTFIHQHSATIKDISALGITLGPGSYTGLRLGVTTFKTLAKIIDCPIYGLHSLTAMVRQANFQDGVYAAIIPAMKGWVNLGMFTSHKGQVSRLSTDVLITEETAHRQLMSIEEPIIILDAGSKTLQSNVQKSHHTYHGNFLLNPQTLSDYVSTCLASEIPPQFDTLSPIYATPIE